jgi:beta-lactamase regulating signal transducer with metallopeptidase domain/HEAT repeat protein
MSIGFMSGLGSLPARDLAMVVLLVKATIILIAALGITVAMQKASAGARHLVWLVALGTLLVVPALAAWAPLRLEILPPLTSPVASPEAATPPAPPAATAPVAAAPTARPAATTPVENTAPAAVDPAAAPARSWTARVAAMSVLSMAFSVWLVVATLILLSLAWSALVVRRIVRQARPLDDESWSGPLYEIADRLGLDDAPRLLRSDEAKMPFACGVVGATIVLPAESDSWTLDRRRAVLLHELAHVRRRDLLGHTLGRLACAFYWFHPLVWTAARELRSESERACDDLALSCGTRAADYAEHLLDIVTSIRRDATPSVALAMARRKEFEGRMLAILDPHLRRSSPSRAQSAALIGSLAVIALVVGAAAPARRVLAQDSAASAQASANVNRDTAREAELPYERHSAPGGYAYRKTERQVTNTVTNKVNAQLNERVNERVNERLIDRNADIAAERALAHRGVDIGSIPDAAVRGTIGALLSGERRSGAKDSDDRPILLAKVLRTDTSAALRRVAAWGLSEYADNETAVAALSDAVLHDKDADVREMAAWALGDGDERRSAGTTALAGALKSDASVKVRATAAWALGNIGSRSSVDALVAALGDASPEVRRRAAWAIGNIGPHEAPAAVIELLKDKDPEVRELAAWDLYQMEDPKAAPALQAALKTETDRDLQLAYIRAIAVTGEKSVDAIRELLESSDQRVRTMAVKALAGGDAAGPWPWPWPEPRPYP